jgi:peptidoglycan hydrolase-like amidase
LVAALNGSTVLEGRQSYTIRRSRISSAVRVSARDGSDADFRLSIPGKIERQFHGTLTVRPGDHKLIAVITMDREVAVASVAAAEMAPSTPYEALKAQAVVARSYYAAAGPRHDDFDFCDTTHCQFLREPPDLASPALRATQETNGLLLAYQGRPLAAMYSAACGGQTRSLESLTSGEYPYYSVPCDYCRRHSPGLVQGHQLGLCQAGAAGMSAEGAGFRTILDRYYPGTSLEQFGWIAIFLLPHPPALRHSKDE